ncbi:hypothetical protein [Microbacterium sp. BDGP8]|uniref:hypothetical protein n=1 Tax=Microbacterium sp. BDGP8 TaxID=3035531 RepID=UPI00249EBA11|nr:hypothetical protein [Microbacterium sp. BDGP8]WHE35133.1 hypothetical protein P6897_10540 [Microbacterium sp. BDGP8]
MSAYDGILSAGGMGNPAMRSPLDHDAMLDVTLSAICARNQYARDAEPVITELIAAAGGRDEVLARAAGIWAGYFDAAETRTLASALRLLPGAEQWVAEGRRRRGIPRHGAPIPRP